MDKESVQVTSPKAYDQVLEYLKTLIKSKDISYGGKIPSERELMETLRISRNSVREALRILEHTGVLESRHGKGNFLVNRMGESLSSVFSMLVLMEESNYREVNQLRSVLEKQAYVQACALISEEGKEKAGEAEGYETADPKVFITGDLALGDKTVVWAVRKGKEAAQSIHKSLQERGSRL